MFYWTLLVINGMKMKWNIVDGGKQLNYVRTYSCFKHYYFTRHSHSVNQPPAISVHWAVTNISSRFTSGDNRVNEHLGLMCMHTLLAREHNRIESVLHYLNRQWSGDRLFEESRRILAAEWQHMIYNEWLPIILGDRIMNNDNLKLVKKGYWNGRNECLWPYETTIYT